MKVIQLSGEVGWGIYPSHVRNLLKEAKGEDIKVEFSSPGGYVFEGIEIFNLFKNYSGNVHFHIVGEACSMGSVIVLSGNKITAEPNAVYMIHNAMSYVGGDHNAMRKRAEVLEGLSNILAETYVTKTGKSLDEIKSLMDEESWFFGSEIQAAGFIDEVSGDEPPQAKETRLAYAKEAFSSCVAKLRESGKDDSERAAALLTEFTANSTITPRIKADKQPKMEITDMNLEKAMADNPGLKAEVEAKLNAQFDAGLKAGKEEVQARINKVSPYLASKDYPAPLTGLAVKVLTGESEPAALEGAVTMWDMQQEQSKATAAEGETGEDTPPETPTGITENGEIKSEDDYQAMINAEKAGTEV